MNHEHENIRFVSLLFGTALLPMGILVAVIWDLIVAACYGREYTISRVMADIGKQEPSIVLLFSCSSMLLLVFAAHFWWH